MDEKKIKTKINRHLPRKSLPIAAVLLAIVFCAPWRTVLFLCVRDHL